MHGKADQKGRALELCGSLGDFHQRFQRLLIESALGKEIGTGIAGNAQFREDDDAVSLRLFHKSDYLGGIEADIRYF